MQITSLQNKFINPSFRSNITFDIGGSQREGSCKIYYATSDDDKEIYTAKTTVNKIGETQFKSSEDFIEQIVQKIQTIQKNNKGNVADMGYAEAENTIKSLTIFIPSYTKEKFAYYLPNHKNLENRPLKDLDFSNIANILKSRGVKIAPNMQFRLLQDAMGTGLAAAKRLYDLGMLEKGKYYTACITGGGCGTSNIEMTDDDNVIVKSTGSGYLPSGDKLEKVSKAGASAPAVITNFCRPFGFNEELVEDIKNCHKAEFTLKNPITYEKDIKTKKLKELLLSTGKYELVNENDKTFTLAVKSEFESLYDMCRENAIEKYCHAFARLAAIKRNEASNGLIITGPLAKAINTVSLEHYGKTIKERIKKHLLSSFNTYELDKTQDTYNFDIYCDDRFFIDDNTACKKLAHQAELYENRGNWIKLPVKNLKDSQNDL